MHWDFWAACLLGYGWAAVNSRFSKGPAPRWVAPVSLTLAAISFLAGRQ